MRELACLCLSLAAMSGCIIVEDDPGSGCPALDEGGACLSITATGCPEDVARFDVVTQELSSEEGAFVDNFGCAQVGVIVVDAGLYDIRVEAQGDEGTWYGTEPVIEIELADGEIFEHEFEFPVDRGFFFVDWN